MSGSITVTMSDEFFTSDANRASLCWINRSWVSAALSSASATCEDSARKLSTTDSGISAGVATTIMPRNSSRMNRGATSTVPSVLRGSASGSLSVLS